MNDFDGRVAIVTGAGRGLGRATAIELARRGAAVALVARTVRELEEVRVAIGPSARASVEAVDLGEQDALDGLVPAVRRTLGEVDILINNAAVLGPLGRFSAVSTKEWDRSLAVNLAAPVHLARGVVAGMLERGYGRILNVSSGVVARPNRPDPENAYLTTKAALEAHTLNLAAELEGSGVTANVFRPGLVDTAMQTYVRAQSAEVVGTDFLERFVSRHERGELAPPEVPARALVELVASPANGEIVSV